MPRWNRTREVNYNSTYHRVLNEVAHMMDFRDYRLLNEVNQKKVRTKLDAMTHFDLLYLNDRLGRK